MNVCMCAVSVRFSREENKVGYQLIVETRLSVINTVTPLILNNPRLPANGPGPDGNTGAVNPGNPGTGSNNAGGNADEP